LQHRPSAAAAHHSSPTCTKCPIPVNSSPIQVYMTSQYLYMVVGIVISTLSFPTPSLACSPSRGERHVEWGVGEQGHTITASAAYTTPSNRSKQPMHASVGRIVRHCLAICMREGKHGRNGTR
jgi:hypothetical protein